MSKFEGQHVLISGAAGGIGLKLVEVFLNEGARVSAHFHRQSETLKPLLEKYGDRIFAISVDGNDEKSIENGFELSIERFGFVNVCIVNHAKFFSEDIPIWEMSLDQWKSSLDVNLTSYFLYGRCWCRKLKDFSTDDVDPNLNANIIFIGSTAGLFGEANHIDYATSKGALQSGFIRSLKNEIVLLHPAARCNIVAPGWTKTPMAEASFAEGKHLKALRTTPLRKVATTEDVAQSCLFFASNQTAGHVTGQILMVHGGMEGRVLWNENLY